MRETLAPLLGRRLERIVEARHWRDGVRGSGDDAIIDLWWYFDGQPPAHVHGDDTGDRLRITFDEPYASYDLGPYGEFRVGAPEPDDLLAGFPGHRLSEAAILGPDLGVWLRFDHRELVVVERADDFVLAAEPADVGRLRALFGDRCTPVTP